MRVPRRYTGPLDSPVPIACALLAGLLAGCGEEQEVEVQRARSTASAMETLADLGYTEVSAERFDPRESGVVLRDPERSCPGYNIYTDRYHCATVLIDAEGAEVARWERADHRSWSNAQLLEGGDLIVIGWEYGATNLGLLDENRYVLRLSWTGEELWKAALNAHHDLELTPSGRLAVLTFQRGNYGEGEARSILREDRICLLSAGGELLECRSLRPAIDADPESFRPEVFNPNKEGEVVFVDPIHANSVEFMHRPELASRHPLYAAGHVLVSMRHQDAVMVMRWETGELVWSWGRGLVEGPHDATVLESGNLLIFDNGLRRGWSRVIELDPVSEELVWEYRAANPEDFFTASRGSAQRLPNGNTLVAESDRGRAFEVTPEGEVVWRWLNPARDDEGRLSTLVRMKRLPVERVAPLLD